MKRSFLMCLMAGFFSITFCMPQITYSRLFDGGFEKMATKITPASEIRRVLREKDAGIISGMKAVKAVLENFQKQVQNEIKLAGVDSWDARFLPQLEVAIKGHVDNFGIASKGAIESNINETWSRGEQLVNAPLTVSGDIVVGGFGISTDVLNVLKDFTFHKLDGVTNSAWDKIRSELTLGVLGGKTPHEVSQVIGKNLTSPSIFKSIHARANVITHTELSRVFDKSAHERMKTAAESVDGLQKQWRHDGG